MPLHLPIVAMNDYFGGIAGIKVRLTQIGLGQTLIYVNELAILGIFPAVQKVNNIAIGTGSIHSPDTGSNANIPINGGRGIGSGSFLRRTKFTLKVSASGCGLR